MLTCFCDNCNDGISALGYNFYDYYHILVHAFKHAVVTVVIF